MLGINKQSKLYKIASADVGSFLKDVGEFLKRDVSSFFNHEKETRTQRSKRIDLNRSFLVGFVLVIYVLGMYGGHFYGDEIKQHVVNVAETLEVYFPSLSNLNLAYLIDEPEVVETIPDKTERYSPVVSQEQAVINVVKQASPAVVSIIIIKEVPVYEVYYEDYIDVFGFGVRVPRQRQNGTEKQRVGGGTGFIVSSDGLVITNKHVVSDKDAFFTVITNEGNDYSATVLARDPFQDLAILKIERENTLDSSGGIIQKQFPTVELGDSSAIQIGQTVVAIGYALGEFRNTVSVGVISGEGRTITASGGGISETLTDILQTDTAINKGNSGGPLLNLRGEVIGVNVAMAEGAQSIGFAIPSGRAKKGIEDVRLYGKIVYAFLGVRHMEITPELKEAEDLPVSYGSLIAGGTLAEPGVAPGSGADKAGLKSGDIILEVNNIKVDSDNSLGDILQKYRPSDSIVLLILRDREEIIKTAVLGEITSEE